MIMTRPRAVRRLALGFLRALSCTVLVAASSSIGAAAERQPPKIVYYGLDAPRPAQFAEHVGTLEAADVPIDGTVIDFVAVLDDGNFIRPFDNGFAGTPAESGLPGPYRERWFERGAEQIRSVSPQRITSNFVRLQSRPGSVDWFDDSGWLHIAQTFRHAAFAAKSSGMVGIAFDPEPYVKGFAQFEYLVQTGFGANDFDAYARKARQRGRETMRAMQKEYPDITVLSLFLNSYVVATRYRSEPVQNVPHPKLALVHDPYALLPYFLDGWLDEAGPEVTIVDGNEGAYYYNAPLDFDLAAARIRKDGQLPLFARNRDAYRRQVQVGSTVYMDAYQDDFPAQFQPELPPGTSWPALFRQNVSDALRTSDEYVWFYGESARFWPAAPGERGVDLPTWGQKLPFEVDAMRDARGAQRAPTPPGTVASVTAARGERERVSTFARARRDAALAGGKFDAANRVVNGDFTADLAGWGFWNDPERDSRGSHAWAAGGAEEAGSLTIDGARAGVSYQSLDVVPGEVLWIQVDTRREGWGEPSVGVAFRDPDGDFLDTPRATFFLPRWTPVAQRGERLSAWSRMEGAIVAPAGATQMVLSLSGDGQRDGSDDTVAYDDVAVLGLGKASEVASAPTAPLGARVSGRTRDDP